MKPISLFLLLISWAFCRNLSGQGEVIDQSYTPVYNNNFDFYLTHSAEADLYGFGQEFIPNLSSLDFVDLYVDALIRSSQSSSLRVEIRSDVFDGPIIGVSSPLFYGPHSNFIGEAHFIFANPAPLIPGQRYVIRPNDDAFFDNIIGIGVPVAGTGPSYDAGRWLYSGVDTTGRDAWFREGVIVPEPG